jgi:hypothetical protein
MKDPYENVLIGEFIFRLGYRMGEAGKLKDSKFSLNLYQQTPLDSVLNDLWRRVRIGAFSWNSSAIGQEGIQSERS